MDLYYFNIRFINCIKYNRVDHSIEIGYLVYGPNIKNYKYLPTMSLPSTSTYLRQISGSSFLSAID